MNAHSPIRPLVLQPDAEPYGACLALLTALRAMPAGQVQPTVVFPYPGRAVELYEAADCNVAVVDELAVLRRTNASPLGLVRLGRSSLRSGRRLQKIGSHHGCNLVHSNSVTILSGIRAADRLSVPHACHIREAPVDGGLLRRMLGPILRIGTDEVVAVSRAAAALAPSGIKVSVVADGCALPIGPARRRSGDRIRVVMLGRISPTKGQDLLVDAVASLPMPTREQIELVFAGEPYAGREPYLVQVQQAAEQAQIRAQWLGYVDHVMPLLDSADVTCVATRTGEGLSLTALESMARGVPVISAARGGIEDLVFDGRTGLVVSPGSAAEIAAALQRLLTDRELWQALSDGGREHAAAFTAAAAGEGLLSVWRKVVAADSASPTDRQPAAVSP